MYVLFPEHILKRGKVQFYFLSKRTIRNIIERLKCKPKAYVLKYFYIYFKIYIKIYINIAAPDFLQKKSIPGHKYLKNMEKLLLKK